jgi:putative FmdB family regulatory protein
MPIYEFECTACNAVFDRLQKLSDADPEECPECGKRTIKRRLTAPAFRLAGSGWYETDFKKDGDKKRNLAGNDDAPKAETKTESKDSAGSSPPPPPAAKPDTGAAGT